ncbi:MAG: hypothetical protein NTX25_05225 [Proteobacteria bacterium]|nr:hypothetical protein [Pseudomonadota bacterium]
MKKDIAVKYPHSANLFQFCRKVLDHKFGGIRVIDQDVGQILGFDPADCSHWKKGKKNIRSIQAMKSIAKHLGVDERLVVDVASGDMSEWEGFFEYTGYGDFSPDPKLLDAAKKDFYRRNANSWGRDKEIDFKKQFEINELEINRIVIRLHETINFHEAPLYLPEIMSSFPDISMHAIDRSFDKNDEPITTKYEESGKVLIEYPVDTKMRPYIRYRIAKAMARYFLKGDEFSSSSDKSEHSLYIQEVQSNLFAAKLLTPANLIRKELVNLDSAKDIVAQLADVFWMSKTFMNGRIKEILEKNSEI